MNRLLLSALAAGTFLAGGMAIAQAPNQPAPPPPHHGGHGFFEELDTNKDGIVTRAEVTALLEKRFAALDTDKNGVISVAEWKAAREAKREERFNKWFDSIDTDKNGQLSREELKAAHERREGRGPEGEHGPDGEGGPHFGHRGFGGAGFGWRGFGPGEFGRGPRGDVSKEQFMAGPLHLFDVLDSNHDGKISPAEREAAHVLMHPMGPMGGPMGPRHHGGPEQAPTAPQK